MCRTWCSQWLIQRKFGMRRVVKPLSRSKVTEVTQLRTTLTSSSPSSSYTRRVYNIKRALRVIKKATGLWKGLSSRRIIRSWNSHPHVSSSASRTHWRISRTGISAKVLSIKKSISTNNSSIQLTKPITMIPSSRGKVKICENFCNELFTPIYTVFTSHKLIQKPSIFLTKIK